jgi:phosphoenolpyruvate phosphomutase
MEENLMSAMQQGNFYSQSSAGALAASPTKAKQLRDEISKPSLGFLMEAHSGLSAKLAEEAGFRGLWASGLTISASMGLRDSNEASWTQVLEIIEYMSDAVSIPILVDGDTGYGNFNNVRRLVRKLCDRGIAGVCIEDKLFPKTNSFIGENQPLASIDEFCGRLKAAKDSQTNQDFMLVARVEALISGMTMEEALKRAEAYHAAGADAILIHSKKSDGGEIIEFAKRWEGRSPLVAVPTTYYKTPVDTLHESGVSAVIWANHSLRASITAMRKTIQKIHAEQSLDGIEGHIASVKEIFRLVGCDELEDAESRYLPKVEPARGIVLAASRGDLGELTESKPKCMIDLYGVPLLERQITTLRKAGLGQVTVVRGYRKECVSIPGIATVDNDRYAETGEAYSLYCAREVLTAESVIAYGDVLFREFILDELLHDDSEIVLAVDASRKRRSDGRVQDLVASDRSSVADFLDDTALLREMSADVPAQEVCGEWIGLAKLGAKGAVWVAEELELLKQEGLLETADMPLLFTRLATRYQVKVRYFVGHWMDVDALPDLVAAKQFAHND